MAKKRTPDAENDVIDPGGPKTESVEAETEVVEAARLRLIDGAHKGDHAAWPAGTEHYDNHTHACPHAAGVDIYGAADPLLQAPGLETFVLQRTERVYGGQ